MTLLISALIAIVGILVYALAGNPKVAEIGRICFGVGLLVTLLSVGPDIVRLLPAR